MKNQKQENKYTQLNNFKEFEFSETRILAGIVNTTELIAIKHVCQNLGLDWSGAFQKIKRDSELSQLLVLVKRPAADGKSYEMVCLPPSAFQDWLYSLNGSPSKKLDRALLSTYQKGLVIYLLQMLKISTEEISRMSTIKDSFVELKQLNSHKKELESDLDEKMKEVKLLKSDIQQVQSSIDDILNQNINQLRLQL